MLLGVVLVTAIMSLIQACYKKKTLPHQIILEEGDNLVTTKLREEVKDKVMEKLNERNRSWGKSFNVIDDVSEEMLSEQPAPPSGQNSNQNSELESESALVSESGMLLPIGNPVRN